MGRGWVCVLLALSLLNCHSPQRKLDTLTLAVPYEVNTLDPHARNTLSNFALLSHFYEPLVSTDAGMKIHPCLARLWENPDQLTWLFYLKPGLTFHSGKPLTSADVVYSFQRLLQHPELEMSGYLTDISDISAISALAIRIHTTRPMSILLNKLRFVLIVPEGSTSETLNKKIDGTGPYTLAGWDHAETIKMIRNEAYWGTRPAVREATFLLGFTPERALDALKAGQCRFAQCNTRKVETVDHNQVNVFKNDSLFLKFISYDLFRDKTPFCSADSNPFKKREVRQAIHLALNRGEMISRLPTFAVPATQPLPPFVFGFNPRIPQPVSDPDEARTLLAKAGYPNGFDVTLHFRSNVLDAAKVAQEQLGRIGIRITLQTEPTPDFLASLRNHEFSFFLVSMGCPTGDASDVIDIAIHSPDTKRRFGTLNYGRYSNPEIDHAIEESAQLQEMDARRDAIQHVMSLTMEDLPWVPVYIDQDVYALDKYYQWKPRNDSFIFAWEIKIQK